MGPHQYKQMDKSSTSDIPLDEQRRAWNVWNAAARERKISLSSQRQAQVIEQWVAALGRRDLSIIDIGCGTGWLCERLAQFGAVTGIDLADEVLERARARAPAVRFITGDLFNLQLAPGSFDVVVTLEVLAHVADQPAFVARLAALLKPGGRLMMATQNRPVMERWSEIGAPYQGQIRRWVDAGRLRELLAAHFENIDITSLVPVGDQGLLRVINSPRLNRLLQRLVRSERIERAKERALLGHTLIAAATRRTDQ